MKYIEIANNLSIRIEDIEAIAASMEDNLSSIVYTHHNQYISTLPYTVLLKILEERLKETKENKELNILKEIGTFAG